MPFGTLACQVEKLASLLANWHAKLKQWHALEHIGMFIGLLAGKNVKLERFWHFGMQARWHVIHTGMQAHWHIDHVAMAWHGTHGMQSSKLSFW